MIFSFESTLTKVVILGTLGFIGIVLNYQDDYPKKMSKFTHSVRIWGYMSSKGVGEMTISTLTINAQVYNEVLETFLILLKENRFAGFLFFSG